MAGKSVAQKLLIRPASALWVSSDEDLAAHGRELGRVAVLWVAYPKGGRSDIDRDSHWPIVAGLGLRPIGQVAVDEVWSALRFRPLAPGEPPFRGR